MSGGGEWLISGGLSAIEKLTSGFARYLPAAKARNFYKTGRPTVRSGQPCST